MTTAVATADTNASANRTGVYLAVLQLVFTLGWTTYVIYLPKLAAQVGIAPSAIILILIWVVTSSALRAPPLKLLGKHRSRPQVPFLAALAMLGYGLAGAVSPYLGTVLRNEDPRLPFVISGMVLLLTTLALSKVERDIAQQAPVASAPPVPAKALGSIPILFIASMLILSLGSQLHSSINSAPFFLRFAGADELQWLLPVFWIGFNIAMFPASSVVKHRGGLFVMGAAGLLGAFGAAGAELAVNLNMLIAAQFVAGAAWGCMLMAAVSAALAIGETGAEGKVVGLAFSALALATFARMAAVAGGLQKLPEYAPLLQWAPVACWSVAGAGLLVIAASRAQRRMAAGV